MALCCLFAKIFRLPLDDFRVLLDQLMPDYLYISDRVHASLGVRVFLSWISAHDVIQGIDLHHMRQKLIAQPKALRGSFHQASDVDDSKNWPCHFLRVVEFHKRVEAWVFDGDESSIWVDGAEGNVFSGHVEVGKDVEGAALADVRHAEQAHLEGSSRPAEPHSLDLGREGRSDGFS